MVSAREDDPQVVDAFSAGDELGLVAVYDRWSPLVYSLALRSLGDVTEAETVTRTVFSQAWAARATFDPGRSRLADWLVDLACRSIADTRAARARRVPADRASEDSAGDESKTGALAERMVMVDGMAHLDTSSRRLLQMALDHDLTLGEIAGRTGLAVEDVRARITTSLMELRHRLEGNADAH
ncbi:sigma-70 family RNA polymerase sigma factor [Microlunatus antarcticus]|uniref:RNA polymerase sigma-70 factor (ECF subfamily) n=1 Tax=Microlunatus antarcticus TaxID=53388 RepID=A0A7W5JXT4_9ACTN|nr:RNA polymerase sigma-70 factor (ECF subfamily) [Microlunatus antarcticus]